MLWVVGAGGEWGKLRAEGLGGKGGSLLVTPGFKGDRPRASITPSGSRLTERCAPIVQP